MALSLVLIAFSAGIYSMIHLYLLDRLDAELVEESNELAEEVEITKTEHEFRRRFRQRFSKHASFGFQVSQMDGTIEFGSRWLNGSRLPCPSSGSETDFRALGDLNLSEGDRWRTLSRVLKLPHRNLVIHVLTPLKIYHSHMRVLLWILIVNGTMALTGATLVGYWIARRVTNPILEITACAERISAENLTDRVPHQVQSHELNRLASTLNRTFDRLQKSIHEIRRFTADAAHELRTPLTVIRTEAEVALREAALSDLAIPPFLVRVVDVTLAEATRLSTLVDQLLMLSRQDAGLYTPHHEEVSLEALLLDVSDTLRIVIENKRQNLVIGPLSPQTVNGDDSSLSQLFFNLIENAMKYTPAGGTITVSSRSSSDQVQITVADTGIGIDRDHIEHLFQRFYRVDASRSSQGTGLGLAISHAIVTAHQGQIRVDSQIGQGTIVTVVLPASSTPKEDSESSLTGSPPSFPTGRL